MGSTTTRAVPFRLLVVFVVAMLVMALGVSLAITGHSERTRAGDDLSRARAAVQSQRARATRSESVLALAREKVQSFDHTLGTAIDTAESITQLDDQDLALAQEAQRAALAKNVSGYNRIVDQRNALGRLHDTRIDESRAQIEVLAGLLEQLS
jgi:hypothetical protein